MTLLLLAFSLTAAMGAAVTGAQAGTPELKTTQTVDIDAPPDKVWAVIKDFKDLTWHPAIKASEATSDNDVGSVRTLDLGGSTLEEKLAAHSNAMMSYTYTITEKPDNVKVVPVTHYKSTIKVEKAAHGSKVVWSGHFHRADPSAKPAEGRDDQSAIKAIDGIYRGGLDALKRHVEHAA